MMANTGDSKRVLIILNQMDYFWSHRSFLAESAVRSGYQVYLACPPGERPTKDLQKLVDLGIHYCPFEMSRHGQNPLSELKVLWRLFKVFSKVRPNFVLTYTVKCNLYGSFVARFFKKLRVIMTITGLGTIFTRQNLKTRIIRKMILFAYGWLSHPRAEFIFQNQDDWGLFEKNSVLKGRWAHLIPGTGVNLAEYRQKASGSENPRILFPARIILDKGIEELMAAAKILDERGCSFVLQICGSPDLESTRAIGLERIQVWTMSPYVQFLGFRKRMSTVYQQADLACLPSYREGIPQAMMEAAASGLPLVVTDVPGCRSVVDPGENGFMVPKGASVELADALQKLIENEVLREKMGRASRQKAVEDFDRKKLVSQILDILYLGEKALEASERKSA